MIYEIKNEFLSVKINSLGAEVISALGNDGFEYIWNGKEWSGHAPVLFPICGRLKDGKYTYDGKEYFMQIHGISPYSEFDVIDKSEVSVTFCLKSNAESKRIYPFDFELIANYSLCNDQLFADFTVNNTGSKPLPYMFGWHPGFNFDFKADVNDFYFDFSKNTEEILIHTVVDRKFILDDCSVFPHENGLHRINEDELDRLDTLILDGVPGFVRVFSDKAPHAVTLQWSDNITHLAVWRMPMTGARYLCLEPWTDLPSDGTKDESFETKKMQRLAPGQKETYSYEVTFENDL